VFIDEAEIYVKAGKGGDGAVAFRREKYIAKGGPNGGDGGNGGDVVFEVDDQAHGLSLYNRQQKFLAENGENGMGKNKHGKAGQNLVLKVPSGTQIYEKDNLLLDLTTAGDTKEFLKGGRGGWGNQHFATSIKQTPMWAKTGERGEGKKIRLILKTIADVGLVGLPNAGKSTLLSVLTHATPKIADYPFTTLEPNLGTFIDKDSRVIFADIPGLIEGASRGRGLGVKFLRHIERTKIIVHLIDAMSDDVVRDYKVIRGELKSYSKILLEKKEIVVLNKIDAISVDEINLQIKALKRIKISPIAISAATHQNLDELIAKIKKNI